MSASVNQGSVVQVWQAFLHARFGGFGHMSCGGCAYTVDGIFGPATRDLTKFWQAQMSFAGLSVDGIVGPQTWNAARWFHVTLVGSSGYWRYYRYTDSVTNYTLPFTTYYVTWFFQDCTVYNPIQHPERYSSIFAPCE